MNDDDIITVNEAENEIILVSILNVDRTSASYGGVRHIEVIAKEIFPNKFPHKFTRKKLTTSQKRALNRKIYAESQWRVGKKCIVVHVKICMGYSEKDICDECLALKHNNLLENHLCEIWSIVKNNNHANIWITLADKAIHGIFNEKPVFEGLSAISDNTKLKPAFRYHSGLGCIVGSTLSIKETKINTYKDIPIIINDIKIKKAIANDMRAYILQVPLPNFPPVVIGLLH
ncbi:hypothetical protein RhiirA5_407408 [Rhizophagus irregularis]|uniref:Uncharacterized protein n=1 Tax=Rhizophagus irregularis TaxID=588596 RepID=A0A2N0QAJ8_9GLOM|nr:hypothetical protein RhiirA5_407408 [Rhizophagus irregularis]